MSLKLLVIAIIAIPLLIWAISKDRNAWKSKSDDELRALAGGDEWGYWPTAVAELRRRGLDVASFRRIYLEALGSDSGKMQYCAYTVLKKHFPELNEDLAKLRSMGGGDDARRQLEALIASTDDSD